MNVITSWPVLAWVSAAGVNWSLPPEVVMKSALTSTLFFSAQVLTCFCMTSLAPGTQWSQKPMLSLPAAPAVRICTSGSAAVAAPNFTAWRREMVDGFGIHRLPVGVGPPPVWRVHQPYYGMPWQRGSLHQGEHLKFVLFRLLAAPRCRMTSLFGRGVPAIRAP